MRFVVSLPFVALLASTRADACPAMTTAYRPLSTKNVTMLPDGGILLNASRSFGQKKTGAYSLVDDSGSTIDAAEEQIAPGLMRLTPKQHADRELNLVEDQVLVFPLQDAAGAPAIAIVPKIAKVTSTRDRSAKRMKTSAIPNETTTITLGAPPPADVVAMVLYGSDHTARAWLPTNRGRTYTLSFGGKSCNGIGMSGTFVGEDVTLAFVDSGGRVSAQTKPVRVKRTPPPPPPPRPV